MMSRKIVKASLVILGLFLLVYVCYQAYAILYPSYKTEVALIASVDDAIPAIGVVVRSETVVEVPAQGGEISCFLVDSGDRVAKGSNVMESFGSAADAADMLVLSVLQEELASLNRAADLGRSAGANVESMRTRIARLVAAIDIAAARCDYDEVQKAKQELTEALLHYAAARGEPADVSARRQELQIQSDAIEALGVAPSGYVTAPVDGYFIPYTDGMEKKLDPQSVLDIPVAELAELALGKQVQYSDKAFKLVSDYTWYYAAVVDEKHAGRFNVGMELTLDFEYQKATSLPVRVLRVETDTALGKAAVILECDRFNADVTGLRCEQAQISFRNYSGFRISRSSLRILDGVAGVYVKRGAIATFKKVDILYETEDYIVSRPNSANSDYVALYDEIIVEGKDIYDGKDLGQ